MLFTTKVDLIAQVFDGAQNQVSYIGGELSNYKYLTVGLDYGLTDYLSVGANIKYLFKNLIFKFGENMELFNKNMGKILLNYLDSNSAEMEQSVGSILDLNTISP